MTYDHNCGLKLLANENFCPRCGTNLQQERTPIGINTRLQHTGDVMGAGISGIGNIIAKDTKGNIININIQSVSFEQFKSIITSTTARTKLKTIQLKNYIR